MTSNELLERLRPLQTRLSVWPVAELEEVQFHDAVDFMRYVGEQIKQSADEIERLQGEADDQRENARAWSATAIARETERDRLRAALEHIAEDDFVVPSNSHWSEEAQCIAREALRSASENLSETDHG